MTIASVPRHESRNLPDAMVSTELQILDAIDRELARQGADYAETVRHLSEAFAWVHGTTRHG
jgi:hypothetical protein